MSDSNSTTIKFCIKCQCETDRNSAGACKPCSNANVKAWREKNAEKNRLNARNWYEKNQELGKDNAKKWQAANPERTKSINKAYRERNPEILLARAKKWQAENPERFKAYRKKWQKENPHKTAYSAKSYFANAEKIKKQVKAWQAANPEKCRITAQNKRARKRENGGKLSQGLAGRLFKLQRGKCACCGLPLGSNYHLDHIMPLALGGPNTDDNIQLLRQRCNNQKHSKHPVDFMQERGFLL